MEEKEGKEIMKKMTETFYISPFVLCSEKHHLEMHWLGSKQDNGRS
jgi:hypothetical protein